MIQTEIAQKLIDRVKETDQKVITNDYIKLEFVDDAPTIVDRREVVRSFPMPLVFKGTCVGQREVEDGNGNKEMVDETIFEGELYMGDTFEIYQIIEGQIIEYAVTNKTLEQKILEYISEHYKE